MTANLLSAFAKLVVVKRSFQRKWFDRMSWLHYDKDQDFAFCFPCVVIIANSVLSRKKHHLQQLHSKKGVGLFSRVGLFSEIAVVLYMSC